MIYVLFVFFSFGLSFFTCHNLHHVWFYTVDRGGRSYMYHGSTPYTSHLTEVDNRGCPRRRRCLDGTNSSVGRVSTGVGH